MHSLHSLVNAVISGRHAEPIGLSAADRRAKCSLIQINRTRLRNEAECFHPHSHMSLSAAVTEGAGTNTALTTGLQVYRQR